MTDILITKFDQNGNLILARQAFANGSNQVSHAETIISDGDGNCYITGSFAGSITFDSFYISTGNTSDMFLVRYNYNGDCLGLCHFGNAQGINLAVDNSDNVICAGIFSGSVTIGSNTITSLSGFDIYLAKSDGITSIPEAERFANNQLIIYANPNAGKCNITIPGEFHNEKNLSLSIFDSYGKLIQQIPVEMNENKIKINLQAEPKGVYNVTLTNGKKNYYGKIVFE